MKAASWNVVLLSKNITGKKQGETCFVIDWEAGRMLTCAMKFSGYVRFLLPVFVLSVIGCAGTPSGIDRVKEFRLTTTEYGHLSSGLVRSQTAAALYGAMTAKEREDRLGQYYTVYWKDEDPQVPMELIFEYQQASSGSRVLTHKLEFPAGRQGGEMESHFNFTGQEYRKSGAIMTWCISLLRNGQVVSRKTSYLWHDDTRS